jgi:hypothetical protein
MTQQPRIATSSSMKQVEAWLSESQSSTGSDEGSSGLTEPSTPQRSSQQSSRSDLRTLKGATITERTPPPPSAAAKHHQQLTSPTAKKSGESLIDQIVNCFQPHHLGYQNTHQVAAEDKYIQSDLPPSYCCLFTTCEPPISFRDYVTSLAAHTKASSVCYVMAAGYALKIEALGVLPVTPRSIHRVYLACLVLAIKSQDDFFRKQSYYAYCGGVPLGELNTMELAAFAALGYNTAMKSADLFALVQQRHKM